MVLGRWVARANRRVVNRMTRPVAGRLPVFGVVEHVGRRSGRRYRTPVNVFPAPDGYTIALSYGPGADWVRNVLAAGGCEIETRGRRVPVTEPRVVHDERRRQVPAPVRPVLRVIGVSDFLRVRVLPDGGGPGGKGAGR